MREELQKNQPVAYRILENALISKNYAHAYLFVGEKGCGKLETAYLLAQSLICEQDGFACETCTTCQRIMNNNFADLIVVDGTDTSIKKKDILNIQEKFNKTAVEASNKKVYILNLIENTSDGALNALLKFLEEPTSDVVAILITEQVDKILPTIISRCQKIPFKRMGIKECLSFANLIDLDSLDAYICSNLVNNTSELLSTCDDENYQNARNWAMQVIENFYNDPYGTLMNIQRDSFNDKKGNDRAEFKYFVDILILFFRSCIMKEQLCENEAWNLAKNNYTQQQAIDLLKVCMESKDQFSKSISVKLLVDSMLIRMKEVI